MVGKSGHVATFDWQTGTLHTELQLQETCRDITYVNHQSLSSYINSALVSSKTNHTLLSLRRNMSTSTIVMVSSFTV